MVVAGDVMVEGVEEDLLVSKIYTESRHIKLFTECFICKTFTSLLSSNSKYISYFL